MLTRWLVATVHLLGVGIALGAILARALALREVPDPAAVRQVLRADTAWGVSALLLIGTGLWRAFGGLEKGSAYYLQQPFFLIKMALLGAVLLLELWPMVGLIRWRIRLGHGQPIHTEHARAWQQISALQALLVVLLLTAATAMARGIEF